MAGRNTSSYRETIKALEGIKVKSGKALSRIVSDAKTRVPGWVATEVAKTYNIKKSEITHAKAGKGGKNAGSIRVYGETVESLAIVYRGRVLTPTHCGLTPKTPKDTYTMKAEIIKGQKVVMGKKKKLTKKQRQNIGKNFRRQGTKTSNHSPIMLMHTGAGSAGKTQYIPFQRKSEERSNIQAIKTLSLPQMVTSERTHDDIMRAINEGMNKRLAQHTKNIV